MSSRRRKRRRRDRDPTATERRGGSARLWGWAAGIGVLVVLAVVGVWLVTRSSGKGPPPTQAPVESGEVPSEEGYATMPANPLDRNDMYQVPPEMQIDPGKSYVATISTGKGDIVVQLDASAAPQTVNNFVFLAREGFYDGLTFHRVEPDFVIQGGDPLGNGAGGPGYTVPAEIKLLHGEGAIAMARRGDQVNPTRASSGSQFYITLAATPFLDGAYTAFGSVIEGMDVVKSIAKGDVIESIAISEE